MSETVRNINSFFRTALRTEIDNMLELLALSDRQRTIFEMFYIQKHDICYIADTLGVCEAVIARELKKVRHKIAKAMGY